MIQKRIEILKQIPFFSSMSIDDLNMLANSLEEVKFEAGDIVFKEHDIGDCFYIVEKGLVEILKSMGTSEERSFGTQGPNEILGEMSLIEDKPRSATVRTMQDSVLLKLTKDQFNKLIVENPHWYEKIANTLSSRLRESNLREVRTLEMKNRELERAYRELKQAQDDLIKQEKLAAIGNVSSRVVHDIKNLLTSIQGFAEIIRTKTPQSKRFADAIVEQVKLMAEMIQEVLDFARGEENVLDIQAYRVEPFLETLVELFESSLRGKDIEIQTNLKYKGTAYFDEMALKRILHNLVNNAKDAIPRFKDGLIEISTEWDGDYWIIHVSDNGKGIPPEILDRIFDPFVTQGKSHGTGLGLSITKKLIEAHRGKISIESEPGEGTTFTIRLPINPNFG
jgi:signal transduction histidine kinase